MCKGPCSITLDAGHIDLVTRPVHQVCSVLCVSSKRFSFRVQFAGLPSRPSRCGLQAVKDNVNLLQRPLDIYLVGE